MLIVTARGLSLPLAERKSLFVLTACRKEAKASFPFPLTALPQAATINRHGEVPNVAFTRRGTTNKS